MMVYLHHYVKKYFPYDQKDQLRSYDPMSCTRPESGYNNLVMETAKLKSFRNIACNLLKSVMKMQLQNIYSMTVILAVKLRQSLKYSQWLPPFWPNVVAMSVSRESHRGTKTDT